MEELERHQYWMREALKEAFVAGKKGEIPVGAVIVDGENRLVAKAHNRKQELQSPLAHAEILAIERACKKLGSWRLENCILYVTLEPCMMCVGAIVQARLGVLVYGADDFKTGAVRTVLNLIDSEASNHRVSVWAGVEKRACSDLIHSWFENLRITMN
ncbi:MAG: tRNA adenosine(34) deaminase TadA [Geminocystis sp.]|nr:tRNA adenosine(34) deaminase TadA [Geminocystis sp.]MCS7148471.1 tRNA adenosine(34) deaminase TadA [Geminocystis sp.]MDW8114955.1 tRNA adenosine(34) deaminase TadA [Geminocystis sp.]MDW8464221.1 tRNA adenosine(34) deaminase TadA [Geminocystis sp.]